MGRSAREELVGAREGELGGARLGLRRRGRRAEDDAGAAQRCRRDPIGTRRRRTTDPLRLFAGPSNLEPARRPRRAAARCVDAGRPAPGRRGPARGAARR